MLLLLISLLLWSSPAVQAQQPEYTFEPYEFGSLPRTWENVELIYQDTYHNSSQQLAELLLFNETAPELVGVQQIGATTLELPIYSVVVTNEQNPQQKPKLLVVSNHHARELITDEMSLRFIQQLINLYGVDAEITSMLDTMEVHVIPNLNADSRDVVIHENKPWLRKNLVAYDDDQDGVTDEDGPEDVDQDGSVSCYDVYLKSSPSDSNPVYQPSSYECTYFEGIDNDGDGLINEDFRGYVDINRNYAAGWGETGSNTDDPKSQIFAGTAPFSEVETQVMREYVDLHHFTWGASLHSGINATWFPLENNRYSTLHNNLFSGLLQVLPESYDDWLTGLDHSSSKFYGGEFGLWRSYLYENRGTRAPFTFELWRNATSVNNHPDTHSVYLENDTHRIIEYTGIEEFFNPTPKNLDALFVELWPAFHYMMETTPRVEISLQGQTSDTDLILSYTIDRSGGPIPTDPLMIRYGSTTYQLEGSLLTSQSSTFTFPSFTYLEGEPLLIGNEYEGYTEFHLAEGGDLTSGEPSSGDSSEDSSEDSTGDSSTDESGLAGSFLLGLIVARRMQKGRVNR